MFDPASFFRRASDRGVTARTSSVLTPLTWFAVPVALGALAVAYKFNDVTLQYLCFGLAAVMVFGVFAAYFYFAVKDPDRLHSERHRVEMRTLELVESKGGPIQLSPTSLEHLFDPHPPHVDKLAASPEPMNILNPRRGEGGK